MRFIDGKKTYLVAAAVVAIMVLEKVLGIDVPGAEPVDNWLEYLMGAFGLGAVRHAVGKGEGER